MQLHSQLTSLPLSKRLKELGVNKPTLFYYVHNDPISKLDGSFLVIDYKWSLWFANVYEPEDLEAVEHYSAFSVAELGEMLPGTHYPFKIGQGRFIWLREKHDDPKSYASTEADARALSLIHLIENKLITIK